MDLVALEKSMRVPWEWIHKPVETLPLTSFSSFLMIATTYFILTAIGCWLMKGKRFNVILLSTPWNIFMTLFSAYACIGTSLLLYNNLKAANFEWILLLCDPELKLYGGMTYWIYIFYLSKYWEYVDTLLLVLKGKPVLPPGNVTFFLHIYHHTITASVGFVTLWWPFSVAYLGPITNGFVHVVMYAYYFLAENNLVNRWWGGVIVTPLQLFQFLLCCTLGVYGTIYREYCNSHPIPLWWLWWVYLSFFGLFWIIYQKKNAERKLAREQKKKLVQKKDQ
eukprot:TRINITY_DN13148_c0_g1_i1.p1 TRINITY_DN13148_c0_g1~~TRINITY_DN13148_c0_g1_i1.p1  ORF type:complete len:279 (-),score=68.12 TRINITY_DN13148_c0_g1_i1:138-974(-)